MFKIIRNSITHLYLSQMPATGIGLFRILFGLVVLQETLFLLYFNHLIFDPIPYIDIEFPLIPFFLCLWAINATCLTVGLYSQQTVIINYIFWLIFVNFTPMQRDFDGGFDTFMIGANLLMFFMPIDKSLSLDNLKHKLQNPFVHYSEYTPIQVSRLCYVAPVVICLGFLYFDSVVHKMFAPHWRNGLGAWLPSSIPYYISPIDFSFILNSEWLQKVIGYTIIVFQFGFIFLIHNKTLRPIFFIIGLSLHLGITLTFNIYPFGLGMLIFYTLVAPQSWYLTISQIWAKPATLKVFYDGQCPLCCRTVLTLNHFDLLKRIEFLSAQQYATQFPSIAALGNEKLLQDLYALDQNNRLYSGVKTYARILIHMRYTAVFGYLLLTPGLHQIACTLYRKIADNRTRINCDSSCVIPNHSSPAQTLYNRCFTTTDSKQQKRTITRLSKVFIIYILLQLNCTLHYGLLYRLDLNHPSNAIEKLASDISNTLILFSTAFIGITPHALYLHDHFAGYNQLIAITYIDTHGKEKWLPFVNSQGRIVSPNWGRVHSMWANIAVTPHIDSHRLSKFIMKVTAFWGKKTGLDLNGQTFLIKQKKIQAPEQWIPDLLKQNLQGEWTTIGTAQWTHQRIKVNIPENI